MAEQTLESIALGERLVKAEEETCIVLSPDRVSVVPTPSAVEASQVQ